MAIHYFDPLNLDGYRQTFFLREDEYRADDFESAPEGVSDDRAVLRVRARCRDDAVIGRIRRIEKLFAVFEEVELAVAGEAVFFLPEIPPRREDLSRRVRAKAAPAEPVDTGEDA